MRVPWPGKPERRSPSNPRRWEVTAEERERIEALPRRPALDLIHALRKRPALVAELARSVVRGAVHGVRDSPELLWYLGNVRIQQVAPDLARGATWYGEESFVRLLAPTLSPETRALELGAGAGRISRHVAPLVRELVCSDPSAAMLDEARENLSRQANVRFAQTAGFLLPQFRDGEFDLVYAHDVFEFFDGNLALALLEESARVLRAGGVCVISFYVLDNPLWAREQLDVARSVARSGHLSALKIRPYLAAQMEALLRLAGFKVRDRYFGGETIAGGTPRARALADQLPADPAALNEAGRCILVAERISLLDR